MYVTCALGLGALTLIHGAAAHNPNSARAVALIRKASNGTTTSTSASSSSVSPCTTTVTSIFGENFVGVKGSCQTVTIYSTPRVQSTHSSSVDSSPKPTSSATPTTSVSTTPKHTTSTTIIPSSTNLERASADPASSSSSTSTPQVVQTNSEKESSTSSIAQIIGHTSSESTTSLGGNGGNGGSGGNFLASTSSTSQVATTAISTPDQKTGVASTILGTSPNLPPTTSAAPVSISTSVPPVWISDGSSSVAISVSQPASTSKPDIVVVGTTTQTPNQVLGTTPASSSQSPAQSFSASNIVGTTQTSESGQAPPTRTDIQSTTQISPVLGSTSSGDTHSTTSQTGTVVSTGSLPPTQTSGSQLPASSSIGTPISNSGSTQASQSISQVGTASQHSSGTVVQSNPPSGTASVSPVSGSASGTASASGSISQVGTASQKSSPTNSASSSGASTTPTTTSYAPILYGSQTISRDASSNFVIGTQTLTPGSAITISGEVISAGTGGAIIINAVPPKTTSTSASQTPEVIVVGGTSITANSNSDFVIGSQTLTPGGAVTQSGEVITLPSASSTPTQTQTGKNTGTTTGRNTLVTSTLSLGQQGPITSVLIGGQTLTAGGRVTVGGDVLSLASGGGSSGIVVVSTVTVMGTAPSSTKKSAASMARVAGRHVVLSVFGVVLAVYFEAC
ncbi:uncharacterized protein PAC_01134 [Phialocephala subalpina]|uniref:Uncharacterized protein n=1 Tax=Phialocephala subalpina TaxID=576137 RepID=A0A1L7WEW5_9HELO|nr:uncharacterized protein PAC_01134 [Phialocephala subalpina]